MDFYIKSHYENADIKEIKDILFRWFPEGAKLKYNYYKISIKHFVILYKKSLYFYEFFREFNGEIIIKLIGHYIINKNKKEYKYIKYHIDDSIKIAVYKYSNKDPILIYSKIKYNCDISPMINTYNIGKLEKNIFNNNDYNITATSYEDTNILFKYKYFNDYVFINKENDFNREFVYYNYYSQFRCFLLFI